MTNKNDVFRFICFCLARSVSRTNGKSRDLLVTSLTIKQKAKRKLLEHQQLSK